MASFDNCSPDTVLGDAIASEMAKGKEIPLEAGQLLGADGFASAVRKSEAIGGQLWDGIPKSLKKMQYDEDLNWLNKSLMVSYKDERGNILRLNRLKTMMSQVANPSTILGDGIVDTVDEKLIELAKKGIFSGPKYKSAVKRMFASLDTDQLNDAQKAYFVQYRDSLKDTSLPPSKGDIELLNISDNVTKGIVTLNPKIIEGNYLEAFMKGLPLYRENFIKGLNTLINEHGFDGIFKEIPEVAENGLYGMDIGDFKPEGFFEKITSKLDRPTRNIVYYAGKVKGGEAEGRKAVQRVLFSKRLGDTPLVYKNQIGKTVMRLATYTVSTINMFYDVLSSALKNPNPDNIASAVGLIGVYGGVLGIPAYLTSQGESVEEIPVIGQIWKSAAEVSSITPWVRLGISQAVFNRRVIEPVQKVSEAIFKGGEVSPKDLWQAVTAIGILSTAGEGPAGEVLTNKLFNDVMVTGIEALSGEKDFADGMLELVPGFGE